MGRKIRITIFNYEGIVVQNIQGTTNINPEAKELLNLVKRFGAQDMVALESAVHELEDPDGRASDRLGARQRLKGFLLQLGGKVEDTALAILQSYVQNKLGFLDLLYGQACIGQT